MSREAILAHLAAEQAQLGTIRSTLLALSSTSNSSATCDRIDELVSERKKYIGRTAIKAFGARDVDEGLGRVDILDGTYAMPLILRDLEPRLVIYFEYHALEN